MTKVVKNFLISLSILFAILFAGIFITGCGIDYNIISLSSQTQVVNLVVSDDPNKSTQTVLINIDNYQAGFSNKVQIEQRGQDNVFSTEISYPSESQISVTITAKNGGSSQLIVRTLEASKECIIDVNVTQYSKAMSFCGDVLYVSNDTKFIPDASMLYFDSHTTQKDVSYYFIKPEQIDISLDTLRYINDFSIDAQTGEGSVILTDNAEKKLNANLQKVDNIELKSTEEEKNLLYINLDGETKELVDISTSQFISQNRFYILSVYDYSVNNDEYSQILSSIMPVYALPNLSVKFSGTYFDASNDFDVDKLNFTDITNSNQTIKIVPNNPDMTDYLIKVEMSGISTDTPISTEKIKMSNNIVDFDRYRYFDELQPENSNVFFWKISQNSQRQNSIQLGLNIFYEVAKEIKDVSVNKPQYFNVEIQIAAYDIMVNSSLEPKIKLYNVYRENTYGYEDMFVDVLSNYGTYPDFDGIYFDFSDYSDILDITYDGNKVISGNKQNLYQDWSQPFRIRTMRSTTPRIANVRIYIVSDIIPKNVDNFVDVEIEIVAGASEIIVKDDYKDENGSYHFYLDSDAGRKSLNNHIYTINEFDSVSINYIRGDDVVGFSLPSGGLPYIYNVDENRYYLNFNVTPRRIGRGYYDIVLGNGITLPNVIFECRKTLSASSTYVQMSNQGNGAVTSVNFSKSHENIGFEDVLDIEILNPSTKDSIVFGNTASFAIFSNATIIEEMRLNNNEHITSSRNNNIFTITTRESNGDTIGTIILHGIVISDFKPSNEALTTLTITVNIHTYSLISEFYLKNGNNFAYSNTVYYGSENISESDKSINFTAEANYNLSRGFYQYYFDEDSIKTIYENIITKVPQNDVYRYTISKNSNLIKSKLVRENYNEKFIYFNAMNISRNSISTYLNVKIKNLKEASDEYSVIIEIQDGLIFYIDKGTQTFGDYEVNFENNIFQIGANNGSFDFDTFRFVADENGDTIILSASLRQEDSTKHYDATIVPQRYIDISSISLVSGQNNLDFTIDDEDLTQYISVYVNPINATANVNGKITIKVEYVPNDDNVYSRNMLKTLQIDYSQHSSGIYTIPISCKDFYDTYKTELVTLENVDLSGRLFIYPTEWGNSYTNLKGHNPIPINYQFRNGSRTNPYVLETAQDVLDINSSITKLSSHYVVRGIIDMSSVSNALPIGILNIGNTYNVVGFSGSIVGENSLSQIININIWNNLDNNTSNFSVAINGNDGLNTLYAGLFARINARNLTGETYPSIENISFSGSINGLYISDKQIAYVGILSSINDDNLTNIGVTVRQSNIYVNSSCTLYYGGIAGVNYGNITQDFTQYEKDGKYDGQSTKILAYYEDNLLINTINDGTAGATNVYAGGVVGVTSGNIVRIGANSTSLQLFGYSGYSAYTQITVKGDTSFGNIELGGIAGVISFVDSSNTVIPYNRDRVNPSNPIYITGLLIGGLVDSIGINSRSESNFSGVGGIAGLVDTLNRRDIFIYSNTVRTFIRGYNSVGAIIGFENDPDYGYHVRYKNDEGASSYNSIQAIDDGRGVYQSAMIIRQNPDNSLASTFDTFDKTDFGYIDLENSLQNKYQEAYFIAVGNGVRTDFSDYGFNIISYVNRGDVISFSGNIASSNVSTERYYGNYLIVNYNLGTGAANGLLAFTFKWNEVVLDFGAGSEFRLKTEDGEYSDVFFMYYFDVEGFARKTDNNISAQDSIENLNYITTNSDFHPFKNDAASNGNFTISSLTSSILTIDLYGNFIVKGTGLAIIKISSLLNVVNSKTIYVFVVNYFNKDVSSSIFFNSNSPNSDRIVNGGSYNVRGNNGTKFYLNPDYTYSGIASDGKEFTITYEGQLYYNGVEYILSPNTELSISAKLNGDDNSGFSGFQIDNQTIIFTKDSENASEGNIDKYNIVPVLKITIGDTTYYYYLSDESGSNISLVYHEYASSIRAKSTKRVFQTNETFKESIYVNSTNPNELLFYQIFRVENGNNFLIQDKLPSDEQLSQIQSYDDWIDFINDNRVVKNGVVDYSLFDLYFSQPQNNNFDFECSVNKNSSAYKNREVITLAGDKFQNIYGEYIFTFYSSERNQGDSPAKYSIRVFLEEAELKYVGINNFSNINDISVVSEVIVPSQRGLFEISLDPVESIFDVFTISNNAINYNQGASELTFSFAYERNVNGVIDYSYVDAATFGSYRNGSFSFTYTQMMNYLNSLNNVDNVSVVYRSKIFIAYYMPALNVADNTSVGIDVTITHGNEGKSVYKLEKVYYTKLGSYAKLSIKNKENVDDIYYVARGMNYDVVLDYFGFDSNQIEYTSSDNSIAEIRKLSDGSPYLWVTPSSFLYPEDEKGKAITINVDARKIVDNQVVSSHFEMKLYVMEYVVNYHYVDGVYEDIVVGMNNGIISIAIGNPYNLEFNIRKYIEYNSSITSINQSVESFINDMTQKITWKIYEQGKTTQVLSLNKEIRSDYFLINGLTFIPLRIYSPENDIYHLSAEANYIMKGGRYIYTDNKVGTDRVYTEFTFDVHEQSTEESPLPIETYDDFISMSAGQWYILLNNITLPSYEYSIEHDEEEFKPIKTRIAGLDGNGYNIVYSGQYHMTGLSDVGVFEKVYSDMIIKNVSIKLESNVTTIFMNSETFNVGLLTSSNEGVITNCSVSASNSNNSLSVVCSETATNSYVAGLVASNLGVITNSRSSLNISTTVNLSGLVGVNSGKIVSSYYRGASLENTTNSISNSTAGLVISNSGEIYTSYVSGDFNRDYVYYNGTSNRILSKSNVSGFVYENSGEISDCYSNIYLKENGASVAGFVSQNSGLVERCFSLCVLDNNSDDCFGFARQNSILTEDGDDNGGVIKDAFYLEDKDEKINVSIGRLEENQNTGIKPISLRQFIRGDASDDFDELFKNYIYSNNRNINSIWFYNNSNGDGFPDEVFNTRLELVAPNIIAYSHRRLDSITTVVDSNGAENVVYNYVIERDCDALGSLTNPILIENSINLEKYIIQENNYNNFNNKYYRLISDINYGEDSNEINSALFNTRFGGYFEGNFMEISGIRLISNIETTYAGMFAEIEGVDVNSIGTVMNLTIAPNEVNFANANVVGTLAGRLNGGKIYNVNVINDSDDSGVQGGNIVGGVVGLTTGNFDIVNINSQMNTKARFRVTGSSSNEFDASQYGYNDYSFAGSLVGVLSGRGTLNKSSLNSAVKVSGGKVGLMFGLVDSNVNVKNLNVDLTELEANIISSQFAGLVVGETKGIIENVEVIGNLSQTNTFSLSSLVPSAIGGFAGLISGGQVNNVNVSSLTIETSTISTSQDRNNIIPNIGGLAGFVSASAMINDIDVHDITIVGYKYVGGIIGNIDISGNYAGIIYFNNISLTNASLIIYGIKVQATGVGGLAGAVCNEATISITTDEGSEIVNKIEYELTMNVNVYKNSNSSFSIGPIIGENNSSSAHEINNVQAKMSCVTDGISIIDVTSNDDKAENIKIDSEGNFEHKVTTGSPKTVIKTSTLNSQNSTFVCDLTFNINADLNIVFTFIKKNEVITP